MSDVSIIQNWQYLYGNVLLCLEECDIVRRSYFLACFVALCAPVIVSETLLFYVPSECFFYYVIFMTTNL
jgi:hypothetical protein